MTLPRGQVDAGIRAMCDVGRTSDVRQSLRKRTRGRGEGRRGGFRCKKGLNFVKVLLGKKIIC